MPDRRDFLSRVAATGFAAALPFDAASLTSPVPVADGKWDLAWPARLRGSSRAVFDSPNLEEGVAFHRACMWRDQLKEVYGTPREDVTPVVVIRHQAIPLIMNDEHWDALDVGKKAKIKDPKTRKWIRTNPIMSAAPDAPAAFVDYTLPKFLATGGIVLACGLAFGRIVSQYEKQHKLSRDDADKRARERIVPGVVLQPSGFFAVLKAQDEGCRYFLGS